MIGIYQIRRLSDGKCYIGQSVNIRKRFSAHRTRPVGYIDNAIQKHGIDSFAFEIIELCDESILDQREIHWIAALDTIKPNGFNLTHGGEGGRPSDEIRRKMSDAHKGKTLSTETRKKLSKINSGENHPQFGKQRSKETLRRMSEVMKGNKPSAETRKKLSEANSGENHPQLGKPRSPETRRKIAGSLKGNIPWNKGKRSYKKSSPLQLKLF